VRRAGRMQARRQVDVAGALRRDPGREQGKDHECRHQHHAGGCQRVSLAQRRCRIPGGGVFFHSEQSEESLSSIYNRRKLGLLFGEFPVLDETPLFHIMKYPGLCARKIY
jgi:hypothetical protein